ncbi:hypothetical protein BU14_0592s0009 [Porphyra umbilicalis]|uniref:Protease Do-like PDZ domain-containing protein n=1 Tax=Porphyra umbilicalis TaxID=2786 RepID=A0A1X6NRV2_PORUM|nr:hypothetical protein BU14_0592s0009 [Porphyra umbilicalis]|eukprot:OSX71113.1 hypothetical protein BU14_0592s0009 [Porphyra umbilicalis]
MGRFVPAALNRTLPPTRGTPPPVAAFAGPPGSPLLAAPVAWAGGALPGRPAVIPACARHPPLQRRVAPPAAVAMARAGAPAAAAGGATGRHRPPDRCGSGGGGGGAGGATDAGADGATGRPLVRPATRPGAPAARRARRPPPQPTPRRGSGKSKPADKKRRRGGPAKGNPPARAPPAYAPPAATPLSPDVVGRARASAAGAPFADAWDADDDFLPASVLDCCVKLYVTHSVPNYSLPWQKMRQSSSTSSGFVRGGDTKYSASVAAVGNECDLAILVVDDEAFWGEDDGEGGGVAGDSIISTGRLPAVKGGGGGRRGGRDSADGGLASGGLVFGPLPRLQDSVTVVGYPLGGENLAITAGVVSRIEMSSYAHGSAELLCVQIDAAINSGNSGGPVFAENNTCVGVAFQSLSAADAEAVGWIIPSAVVHHFLVDYGRNGRYTGFPTAGFDWQRLESGPLRAAVGVGGSGGGRRGRGGGTPPFPSARAGEDATADATAAAPAAAIGDGVGVLVKRVDACGDVARVLRRGDVLTAIDGVAVSSAGTVPFRRGERIHFSYLIASKFVGDEVTATAPPSQDPTAPPSPVGTPPVTPIPVPAAAVTPLTVTYKLPSMAAGRLVPVHDPTPAPPFLVVAGLVFFALTQPYLEAEFGEEWRLDAPVGLVYRALYTGKASAGDQVVVLAQVLSHALNRGYEHLNDLLPAAVLAIDGTAVRDLAGAAAALAAAPADGARYIRFDLEGDMTVVVERASAAARMGEVLDAHGIPRPRGGDDAGGLGVLHNWAGGRGGGGGGRRDRLGCGGRREWTRGWGGGGGSGGATTRGSGVASRRSRGGRALVAAPSFRLGLPVAQPAARSAGGGSGAAPRRAAAPCGWGAAAAAAGPRSPVPATTPPNKKQKEVDRMTDVAPCAPPWSPPPPARSCGRRPPTRPPRAVAARRPGPRPPRPPRPPPARGAARAALRPPPRVAGTAPQHSSSPAPPHAPLPTTRHGSAPPTLPLRVWWRSAGLRGSPRRRSIPPPPAPPTPFPPPPLPLALAPPPLTGTVTRGAPRARLGPPPPPPPAGGAASNASARATTRRRWRT